AAFDGPEKAKESAKPRPTQPSGIARRLPPASEPCLLARPLWQERHRAKHFQLTHKQRNGPSLPNSTRSVGFTITKRISNRGGWRGVQASSFNRGDRGMIGGLRTTSRYLLAGASVIGLLTIGSPGDKAQDMQQIQAQIDQMQATIKALQKQVQDAKAQASAANATAADAASKSSDIDLKVAWKGAPQFSSADGKKFTFKVRGRVEAEYENINQDTAVTTYPDVSATQLRRARLGVEGVAYYDVKYILEVDFANDVVQVKDAYLQYQGVKIGDTPVYFRAGNFRTPNSFELLTSELFVDTLERANFISAWQLDRQVGFQISYWTDHWGLAAGIFGDRFPSANSPRPLFPRFTGDEDLTFAARATVAPINRQVNGVNQVLHFGASVRTRDSGNDQPLFQYTARGADLHLANNTINSGRIGDSDTFWGLEAASLWGPFSL